jgi:hypothetical protein
MQKIILGILILLSIIALAYFSVKYKQAPIKNRFEIETISVETLARWCDETPELHECRKFKINNRRDK